MLTLHRMHGKPLWHILYSVKFEPLLSFIQAVKLCTAGGKFKSGVTKQHCCHEFMHFEMHGRIIFSNTSHDMLISQGTDTTICGLCSRVSIAGAATAADLTGITSTSGRLSSPFTSGGQSSFKHSGRHAFVIDSSAFCGYCCVWLRGSTRVSLAVNMLDQVTDRHVKP